MGRILFEVVLVCVLFSLVLLLAVFSRCNRQLKKIVKEEALAKITLAENIVSFQLLVENSAAAIYVFRRGRFVMVNPAMEAITGYSCEELMSMEGLEYIHPDHRPSVMERNAARERGEAVPSKYELKLLTKCGEVRWVDFTAKTALFDGELCTVGSAFDITGRKTVEDELQERERLLRTMVETSPDCIATASLDGVATGVSTQCLEMWGCKKADEMVGRHMLEFVDPAWHDKASYYLGEMLKGNYTGPAEYMMVRLDGSSFYADVNAGILRDASGKPNGFFFVERDITDRKRAEEALRESEEKYRFLTENMKDVIWTLDVETLRFLYVSPSVEQLRGYTPEEIMAKPLDVALTPESARFVRGLINDRMEQFKRDGMLTTTRFYTEEAEQPRKDGTTVWTEVVTVYWRNPRNGRIELHGVTRDISERKEAAARMAHMAHHDPLTGLPNRALFTDRLERAIAASKRNRTRTALMFLDLDKFKPVNDTYGHAVGDVLLQEVATRMKAALRESDTVGRIGGDEFVVLLPMVERDDDALSAAEVLRNALNTPFDIGGHSIEVSCSIGIALYPDDGLDKFELARNADAAMYRAKGDGGDCVRLSSEPSSPGEQTHALSSEGTRVPATSETPGTPPSWPH